MENNDNCCISRILKAINVIQRNCINGECIEGCERPILGPNSQSTYNTRPVTLYSKNGELFTVQYYVNNVLNTSSTFRVEDVNGCCAKLRILEATTTEEETTYTSTNEFVTINTNCFSIIRCLADTYVEI